MAAITWEAYFVIFVLITVFACLIKGFRTPEIIFFGGLIACWNATIISTDEAVSGFSNTGLLTVGVLNVVIKGVERSGAAARVCRRAFGSKTSFRMGMLRMQSLCYLISGFFNNTPIVALLIPITRDWARQRGFAPSHFLIPLSFAAIFGGTLTIIGTSTNLLVNGLLADAGFAQFGFFEPAYVGAPLGLFGIAYCVLLADRLLPVRGGLFRAARDRAQEMLTQVEVLEDFAYADQTLEAVCGKLNLPFSAVVKLRRPKVVARSRVPTEGQLQLSDMAAGAAAGRRRAASEAAWGTPHDLDVLQGPRSSRRNSKEHAKESPRAAADPAAEILKLPLAAAAAAAGGGALAPVVEGGVGEEEGGDGASSDGGGGGGDGVRPPAPAAKATLYRRGGGGGGGNGDDDGEEGKSGEPQLIWNLEDGMPYRDFFPVSKNQGCRVGDVLFLSLGRAALLQLAGEKRAQGLNLLDTAAADLAEEETKMQQQNHRSLIRDAAKLLKALKAPCQGLSLRLECLEEHLNIGTQSNKGLIHKEVKLVKELGNEIIRLVTEASEWLGKPNCQSKGCLEPANHGWPGATKGLCAAHKMNGMVPLDLQQAGSVEFEEAKSAPSSRSKSAFGEAPSALLTAPNAPKHDQQAGCAKKPRFKYRYDCEHGGCSLGRLFNFEGEKRGRFCSQHKLQGMVNIMSKKCERAGCSLSRSFNFDGEQRGRFCSQHKLQGMVNIANKKCEHTGCNKMPSFNFEAKQGVRFCAQHKLEGMVQRQGKPKKCEHAFCSRAPSFNFEGEVRRRFCSQHKVQGMVDLKDRNRPSCEHAGCTRKDPSFCFEGEQKGRFCGKHKLQGMVAVAGSRNICEHAGCGNQASFNFEGQHSRRFCSQHRVRGMVNVMSKRCEHAGCIKCPTFNFQGERSRRFCAQHMLEGMVCVVRSNQKELESRAKVNRKIAKKNKNCEHGGCSMQGVFNFVGEKRGRFCSQHKLEGMVNQKNRKCEHAGCEEILFYNVRVIRFCAKHRALNKVQKLKCEQCSKRAHFNFKTEGKARFCAKHKLEEMVNVVSRPCEEEGCFRHPSYNYEGEQMRRFCWEHKHKGMVSVAFELCEHAGCSKIKPAFAFQGELKGRFCKEHKSEGMVSVKKKPRSTIRRRKCKADGCNFQPSFNFPAGRGYIYCSQHKMQGMVDMKNKRCKYIGCGKRPHFNYAGTVEGMFCAQHKEQGMVNVCSRF